MGDLQLETCSKFRDCASKSIPLAKAFSPADFEGGGSTDTVVSSCIHEMRSSQEHSSKQDNPYHREAPNGKVGTCE